MEQRGSNEQDITSKYLEKPCSRVSVLSLGLFLFWLKRQKLEQVLFQLPRNYHMLQEEEVNDKES